MTGFHLAEKKKNCGGIPTSDWTCLAHRVCEGLAYI